MYNNNCDNAFEFLQTDSSSNIMMTFNYVYQNSFFKFFDCLSSGLPDTLSTITSIK